MPKFGARITSFILLITFSIDSMSAKTDDFINKYSSVAINEAIRTGIPASITMAQAILESGWGDSGLSVEANNFFGIKADSSWNGPVYNGATHEVYGGVTVFQDDDFRKYNHPRESFRDHSKFLQENARYDFLWQYSVDDYRNWAIGLKKAGYATSPTYAEKLIGVVEQYGLHQLDQKAKTRKMWYTIGLVVLVTVAFVIFVKVIDNIFR